MHNTIACLSPENAQTVERARKVLEGVWSTTYEGTTDLARDFGRLEIEARDLLEIIEKLTATEPGGPGRARAGVTQLHGGEDRADLVRVAEVEASPEFRDWERRMGFPAGPDLAALRRLLFALRERLENGACSVIEMIGCLGAPEGSLAQLAVDLLGTPAAGDVHDQADEDSDGAEPYCTVCGGWAGIFLGLDGWQHFRGDPAPGGKRELYEAGHEAVPAFLAPPARSVSPDQHVLLVRALDEAAAVSDDPDVAAAYRALRDQLTGLAGGAR